MGPTLREIDLANQLRADQDRAFAQLGGAGPSIQEMKEMSATAVSVETLFSDLEMRVPEPDPTDRPVDYEARLLQRLARFSPGWKDTDLQRLARHGSGDALAGIDRAVVADARRVASDKTVGSFRQPGQLREIVRESEGSPTTVDFYGDPRSWMDAFAGPVRLAVEHVVGWRR
jgi:hypothetical protein